MVSVSNEEEPLQVTEEYYEPEGTITSPDFPNPYPVNCFATYRLFTDSIINVSLKDASAVLFLNVSQFQLHFESFAMEASEDCSYDYLRFVFEATSPGAAPDT